MGKKIGKKILILIIMIIGVAAGCIIMLHDYDDLRETERDISTPPSPSSSVISNIIPQPFDSKVVSTKYLVGFMYDTADFLEMAPSFECRYLYDGRVEARFWHDNPGSGRTLDIRYYELDEKQQKNVNDGIDLKKLYNLDPECENPEDVCDGGYSYIYIYDPEGEVFKACGGFCPTNKEFNKMLGVLHENLPDELVDDALNYKRQWQFYEQIASYGSIGIFTGYDGPLKDITGYSHIVIEAQNYSKEEIENYKGNYGRYVLGYLNVGSLEGFRDYYNDFADLSLGEYENWPGEVWVDVSDERWQDFIIDELAPELLEKGVDGFFVDNCDVYYNYPAEENYRGLVIIMESLKSMGVPVFINGGEDFLDTYIAMGGTFTDVADGINQESVFSKYDFENECFGKQDEEETEYYKARLADYKTQGAYIMLTEYTDDPRVIHQIKTFCYEKDYGFYITDSIELDYQPDK